MASHHFVPQYYFRHFSQGRPYVHLLLRDSGQLVFQASIKGQCAHRNFYGHREVEEVLADLEGRHARATRKAVSHAWGSERAAVDEQMLFELLQALLLQRARTDHEVEKKAPAYEAQVLEMFKEHLRVAPSVENRDRLLRAIEEGEVAVRWDRQHAVLVSVSMAIESVLLVTDLGIYLLRNLTEYPFVFSDAPVVFCNTYLRNVRSRGVLGLQTPGLQVFMPLDSRTMLMLIDDAVYGGRYKKRMLVDVLQRADISMLNALQLHHSRNALYFASRSHSEYVSDLWLAHRNDLTDARTRFEVWQNALIDGEPSEGEVYHVYDPQIEADLDLSFVEVDPIQESGFRFSHRSPELVEEYRGMLQERDNPRERPNA